MKEILLSFWDELLKPAFIKAIVWFGEIYCRSCAIWFALNIFPPTVGKTNGIKSSEFTFEIPLISVVLVLVVIDVLCRQIRSAVKWKLTAENP